MSAEEREEKELDLTSPEEYWNYVQDCQEEDERRSTPSNLRFYKLLYLPVFTLASEYSEGEILNIGTGCHIDEFIAVVAYAHDLQEGPVTGRAADDITSANTAAEVALRLVRPRKRIHHESEDDFPLCYLLAALDEERHLFGHIEARLLRRVKRRAP
ncbi:hypothetical protein ACH5RR_005197 [Cinchona calisaya]|uniref:Uncharacterized protein n=1 Tax=Cinchona calisaya TaxID=153742 RepID=A0ABD3AKH1_9GENT